MPDETNEEQFYPKYYPVEMEVGKTNGDNKSNSVSLDNDFILTGIRHTIIDDGSGNPVPAIQDGAYRLGWSIQTTTKFYKGADPMCEPGYGSPKNGIWRDLPAPLHIGQNRTLEARVTNTFTRANDWKVQVIFVGLEPVPAGQKVKF